MRAYSLFFLALRLFIAAICLTAPALADNDDTPIDRWLQRTLDKAQTTADMRNAIGAATEKWDKELNKVYKKLRRRMNKEQGAALLRAEKAWLTYRDAEAKLIDTIYFDGNGTVYYPMGDEQIYDMVKDRTLQLQEYDSVLDDQEGR